MVDRDAVLLESATAPEPLATALPKEASEATATVGSPVWLLALPVCAGALVPLPTICSALCRTALSASVNAKGNPSDIFTRSFSDCSSYS